MSPKIFRLLIVVLLILIIGRPAIAVAQETIAAPTNVTASNAVGDPNTLVVSWQDNSNNEDGFSVRISTTSGSYGSGINLPANQTLYSWFVGCDTTWNIVVWARRDDGSTSATAEIHGYYLPCSPATIVPQPTQTSNSIVAPSSLWAHSVGDGYYIVVEWDDGSGNEDGFTARLKARDGSFDQTISTGANIEFATFYAGCGKSFNIEVFAWRNTGEKSASAVMLDYYQYCPTATPPVPVPTNTPPPTVPSSQQTVILKTPRDLRAYPGSDPNDLVITWMDYSDYEDGNRVILVASDGTRVEASTGPDGVTITIHVGCGKTWTISVYAFTNAGQTSSTAEISGYYHFCPYTATPVPVPTPTQGSTQSQSQQSGNSIAVSMGFRDRDVIQIGYPLYVIIGGERKHVPNPETLDALGISRSQINNRGYSESELTRISQGPDIPDVNRDPNGFWAFKNQYFSGSVPIQPQPTTNSGSSGGGNQIGPTATRTPRPNATSQPSAPEATSTPSFSNSGSGGLVSKATEQPLWCWVPFVCPPEVQAAVNTKCDPQCVITARDKRPDLNDWAPGAGTSDNILAIAQNKPQFTYNGQLQQVRVRNSNEQPQAGDLVVWPSGCDKAWSGGGHIGYVDNGNPFTITDSNWVPVAGSTCSRRDKEKIDTKNCMRFITSPYPVNATINQPVDACSQYSGLRWVLCKWFGWK